MHFISLQTYRNPHKHITTYIKLIIQFIIFEDQEMFARLYDGTILQFIKWLFYIAAQISVVWWCKNIWNLFPMCVSSMCGVIEYVYFCDKKRVSSLIHCMVFYDYYTAYILLSLLLLLLLFEAILDRKSQNEEKYQHILFILHQVVSSNYIILQ